VGAGCEKERQGRAITLAFSSQPSSAKPPRPASSNLNPAPSEDPTFEKRMKRQKKHIQCININKNHPIKRLHLQEGCSHQNDAHRAFIPFTYLRPLRFHTVQRKEVYIQPHISERARGDALDRIPFLFLAWSGVWSREMRDARFSYLLGGAVTRKYIINLE
jgi:hypothetical protein